MFIKGSLFYKLVMGMKKAGYKKIIMNKGAISAYPCRIDESLPEIHGWPAIWKVCDDLNLKGCGNSHQKQYGDKLSWEEFKKYQFAAVFVPSLAATVRGLDYNSAFPAEHEEGMVVDLTKKIPVIELKALDILYAKAQSK